jgi:hypothetical protein
MEIKTFSIIIPNWNGERFLRTCFDSVKKQTFQDFEIILVDNGSTDSSVDFTRINYPKVNIVSLKKNLGFAAAVNAGMKVAEGKLIALLNNDTEVDKEWLSEILKASSENDKVSFFASKILEFNNRDIIDSCGDGLFWSGRSYGISKGKKYSSVFSTGKFVFGATAGAAVYKKELIEKVGLFDEDFFMYLEDVDYDMRAQLLGLKCLYVPNAIVYHIGSATSGKNSGFIFKYITRNRWHLMHKNFPGHKLLINSPIILLSEIRFIIAAVRHMFIKEYLWAITNGIKQFPLMAAKRKKIQRSRTATFAELNEIIK